MNRAEKESRIRAGSGQYPSFQEVMELKQKTRDDRLRNTEDKAERDAIEKAYDDALDRILAGMALGLR